MIPKCKNVVLLTGAGFSANFGGFLAREMWSKILNNVKMRDLPEVKKILMSNFDFEDVYFQVMSGTMSSEDKELFQGIVVESYQEMDLVLRVFCDNGFSQYGVNWHKVSEFLRLFSGVRGESGVHFTLNQDLLLERSLHRIPLGMTQPLYHDYWQEINSGQLDPNRSIILPDVDMLDDFREERFLSSGDLWYVKLHGSLGWRSVNGGNQMVLGMNKLEDIKKEPLLSWYLDLFQQVLCRPNVKLFVIGYSFKDKHINEYLLQAINEYGLEIYVISPEDPGELKRRLEGRPVDKGAMFEEIKSPIWKAIANYFPYSFKDIFPAANQLETHAYRDIKKALTS